eukprot:5035493-Pleurochrysis_carterae.AAC.1
MSRVIRLVITSRMLTAIAYCYRCCRQHPPLTPFKVQYIPSSVDATPYTTGLLQLVAVLTLQNVRTFASLTVARLP